MQTVARWIMGVLLAVACLIGGGLFCYMCGMLGMAAGLLSAFLLSMVLPQGSAPDNSFWQFIGWFVEGGAVVGAIGGLIVVSRIWWSQAKDSDDVFIRRLANNVGIVLRTISRRIP